MQRRSKKPGFFDKPGFPDAWSDVESGELTAYLAPADQLVLTESLILQEVIDFFSWMRAAPNAAPELLRNLD